MLPKKLLPVSMAIIIVAASLLTAAAEDGIGDDCTTCAIKGAADAIIESADKLESNNGVFLNSTQRPMGHNQSDETVPGLSGALNFGPEGLKPGRAPSGPATDSSPRPGTAGCNVFDELCLQMDVE